MFGTPDKLSLPPQRLIWLVAWSPWADNFIKSGELSALEMMQFLGECGIEISEFTSILDFGCGCGRVTRFLRGLDRARIHGSDYNPRLVSWCKENLTFAEFDTNDQAPPLRYESDSFDFIFMGSVFTHLDEELQKAWMNELKRVLAPGGYIYFTTHGEK